MARRSRTNQEADPKLASALAKETAQKLRRFVGQDAWLNLHLMVELRMVEDRKNRARRTCFWIGSGKNKPIEPRMNHGPGAHGTGLKGYEKRAAVEAVVAQSSSGSAQCHDFGVGCRVQIAQDAILTARNDRALAYDHRANRHLARLCGQAGFGKCGIHGFEVCHWQGKGIFITKAVSNTGNGI